MTTSHRTSGALEAAMALLGWDDSDLAARLTDVTGDPWTADKVYNLRNDRKRFTDETVRALCEATGFGADWFLFGPPDAPYNRSYPGSLKSGQLELIAV